MASVAMENPLARARVHGAGYIPRNEREARSQVGLGGTRTSLLMAAGKARSIGREMTALCQKGVGALQRRCCTRYRESPATMNTTFDRGWKEDSVGLYLLIHGLDGRPSVWNRQFSLLERAAPHADIRVPPVPRVGQASLDECAAPFIELVRDYVARHPGRPICLMGFSRGGQIAAKVELALRNIEGSSKVFVSAVSGTFLGTRHINFTENTLGRVFSPNMVRRIMSCFVSPVVAAELRDLSRTNVALLDQMAMGLGEGEARGYEFYTSRDETAVVPYSNALPKLPHANRYVLVDGHSHNSIVPSVAGMQIENCVSAMDKMGKA